MNTGGEIIHRLSSDLGTRTVAMTFLTLTVNGATATEKLISAWVLGSAWYGALGTYDLILCISRYYLFRYAAAVDLGKPRSGNTEKDRRCVSAAAGCGLFLLVISVSFLPFVYYMAFDGRILFASRGRILLGGTVALYKIVYAGINLRRDRFGNLILQSIRKINYADAVVALVAFAVSYLTAFAGTFPTVIGFADAVMGTVGCTVILSMGLKMLKTAGYLTGKR